MTARVIRGVALVAVVGALLRFGAGREAPRNLILISIDTLRADHLGSYGYARATSPALDAFARRGARFTRAVSQAPSTPYSHMTLLTSMYTSALGVGPQDQHLPAARTTLAEILHGHGFATWGFVDGGYLRRVFGFDQGFDSYQDLPVHVMVLRSLAEQWLRDHHAERFFLFFHFYDVHSPYKPPKAYRSRFEDPPYRGNFEPTTEGLLDVQKGARKLDAEDLRHVVAQYDAGISYADDQLGLLFTSLEARGLLASSVVVVLADHGEEFLEHGSVLHWQNYFAPNLHVPLIVVAPGRQGMVVDGTVELIDVLPTVLDLLGLPPHPEAMGRSLVPRMDGAPADPERVAYEEPFELTIPVRTVISDRYQLIVDTASGARRLFDLAKDPFATVDVAAREPAVVATLAAALEAHRSAAAARAAGAAPGAPTAIDEETRRQLRALGYVQ